MPALAMNETRPIYGRARMYAPHGLGNQLAQHRNSVGKLSVLTGGQLQSLDYSFLRDADGLQGDAAAPLMTPQPRATTAVRKYVHTPAKKLSAVMARSDTIALTKPLTSVTSEYE